MNQISGWGRFFMGRGSKMRLADRWAQMDTDKCNTQLKIRYFICVHLCPICG